MLILSNKGVICKLTITPTHKMAAPMWSKILPHVDTRWPAGEESWEAFQLLENYLAQSMVQVDIIEYS